MRANFSHNELSTLASGQLSGRIFFLFRYVTNIKCRRKKVVQFVEYVVVQVII